MTRGREHFPRRFLRSSWTRALLFWAFAFLLAAAAAQFMLPGDKRPRSHFFGEIFEAHWKAGKVLPEGRLFVPAAKDLAADSFLMPKPANTNRVFIIGGSVPNNLGRSAHLPDFRRALAGLYPGIRTELVNSALPGYDSFRVLRVEREVLGYAPDRLIIMSGNNEFYNRALGTADYLRHLTDKVRLLSFLPASVAGQHSGTGKARGRNERLADYAANIGRMLRRAKSRKIETVLCTIPLNRRACAPLGDFPPDRDYIRISVLFWRGRDKEALAAAKAYVKNNPLSALGFFRLGEITQALGRKRRAGIYFDRALDLDYGSQSRSSSLVNSVIRQTAAAEGARLADIDAAFEKLKRGGTTDADIFTDNCHMHDRFRALIFNTMLHALDPKAEPLKESERQERNPPWISSDPVWQSRNHLLSDHSYYRFLTAAHGKDIAELEDIALANRENFETYLGIKELDWRVIDMHMGEALRRMGHRRLARKFLGRAESSGLECGPLFLSLALLEADAGNAHEARRRIKQAEGAAEISFEPLLQAFSRVLEETAI